MSNLLLSKQTTKTTGNNLHLSTNPFIDKLFAPDIKACDLTAFSDSFGVQLTSFNEKEFARIKQLDWKSAWVWAVLIFAPMFLIVLVAAQI